MLFEGKNGQEEDTEWNYDALSHYDKLCRYDHSWMEVSSLAMVPNCGADDLWVNHNETLGYAGCFLLSQRMKGKLLGPIDVRVKLKFPPAPWRDKTTTKPHSGTVASCWPGAREKTFLL